MKGIYRELLCAFLITSLVDICQLFFVNGVQGKASC